MTIAGDPIKRLEKAKKRVIKIFSAPIAAKTCLACVKGPHSEGCCHGCNITAGYLSSHYSPEDVEKIKRDYGFSYSPWEKDRRDERQRVGFWDTKNGCTLPREIRSGICQGYTCGKLREAVGLSDFYNKSGADEKAVLEVFRSREKRPPYVTLVEKYWAERRKKHPSI